MDIVSRIEELDKQKDSIRLELEDLFKKVVEEGRKVIFTTLHIQPDYVRIPDFKEEYFEISYSFIVGLEKIDFKLDVTIEDGNILINKSIDSDYVDSRFLLALLKNKCTEFKEVAPSLINGISGKKAINTIREGYFLINKSNIEDTSLGKFIIDSNILAKKFIEEKTKTIDVDFVFDRINLVANDFISYLDGDTNILICDSNNETKDEILSDMSEWLQSKIKINLAKRLNDDLTIVNKTRPGIKI